MNKLDIEVSQLVQFHGWTKMSTFVGTSTNYVDDWGVNIEVFNNGDFELAYYIPGSTFSVVSGRMGAITNSWHFQQAYTNMRSIILRLGDK